MPKVKGKQTKHIPMRMCIVTRERKPKLELMRLVRVNDSVKIDPKGKERGRGANITMDVKVFDEAVKKGIISRALKLKKKLAKKEVEKLRNDFVEGIEEKKFRKGNKPIVLRVSKKEMKQIKEDCQMKEIKD